MATLTVFADAADGYLASTHITYSTARAGGTLEAFAGGTEGVIGQLISGNYQCFETPISFDTSPLDDAAVISAVALECYGADDDSVTDFTVEARLHDWGATLETGDWVAGASLGALTLLASKATSGWSIAGYNSFTESGTDFQTNINKTGTTRMLLCSSRHRGNNTPTGNEWVNIFLSEQAGTTQDPKLTITYTTSVTHSAAAVLALALTLSPAGRGIFAAASALTGTASLATAGSVTQHAAAALALSTTLGPASVLTANAVTSLPLTINLAADGKVNDFVLALTALDVSLSLAPTANNIQHAAAAFALAVTMSALGAGAKDAAVVLAATLSLDVIANLSHHPPAKRAPAGTGRYGILPPAGHGGLRR